MQHDLLDETRGSRNGFSHREIQVLELAAQGMTNPEIARRLGLSVHGIKFHLGSVYRKLGVANRTEAAVAFTLGLTRARQVVAAPVDLRKQRAGPTARRAYPSDA